MFKGAEDGDDDTTNITANYLEKSRQSCQISKLAVDENMDIHSFRVKRGFICTTLQATAMDEEGKR